MKAKRIISVLIMLCFFALWPSVARAEDEEIINEHEQRVIDEAATREYTLDGKTYITTPSGMEALKRKMKTVDLNAQDAQAAIKGKPKKKEIEEQLAKGYIQIIADTSSEEESEEADSKSIYIDKDNIIVPDNSEEKALLIWNAVTSDLLDEVLEAIEEKNNTKNKFSSYKMPSKGNAIFQVFSELGTEEVKITDKKENTLISYTDLSAKSKEIEGNIIHMEWLIPLSLVFLFLSVVCIYVEVKNGYYMRRREDGPPKNQKLRGVLLTIMSIVMAADIFVVSVAAGLFSGMLRSSSVVQALNNSSYYDYAYAQMAENTVRILQENNIYPLELTDALRYDEFVLITKKQIEKQVSTLEDPIGIDKIQDNVGDIIDEYFKEIEEKSIEKAGKTETKEEKKERKAKRQEKTHIIANSIMTNYKKYADFYMAHFIRQLKRDVKAVFQVVVPIAALTLLINVIGLYNLFFRRYKGIAKIGISMASINILALAAFGFVFLKKVYANIYVSPKYLYYFVLTYLDDAVKPFLVISILLLILAGVIFILNQMIFRRRQQM